MAADIKAAIISSALALLPTYSRTARWAAKVVTTIWPGFRRA
jgi:hypothetical protein